MSAVSYASVAESPVDVPSTVTPEPTITKDQQPISTESNEETHLPSPKSSPVPAKQVSLAPAPIPEVNAWGNVSVSSATSSRSNSNIDVKFWPSASEIDLTQPNVNTSNSGSRRNNSAKNQTEKWVPFKGATIVSQSQSQNRKSSQKRHNKNNSSSNNANNSTSNNKSNDKKRRNKSEKRQQQQQQNGEKAQQPKEVASTESTQQPTQQPAQEETKSQPSSAQQEQTAQSQGQPQQQSDVKDNQQRHFKQNHQYQPQPGQVPHFYQGQQQFPGQQQRPQFRQYNNNNNNRRFNNNNRFNNGFQRHNNPNTPFVPYQQRRHQNHQVNPQYHNNYHPMNFNFNPSAQLNRNEEPLFSLIKQIEYYFSVENLIKDFYLRKQMNNEGWLPVKVIAAFKRLSILSAGDLSLVKRSIDELNDLELLELGEFNNNVLKIRLKENWANWVLPNDQRDSTGQDESKLINLIPRRNDVENNEAPVESEASPTTTEAVEEQPVEQTSA